MDYTIIHATHEAIQKAGGIGTVLEGLITSAVYQKAVTRSFLVGPLLHLDDEDLLAASGEVRFSTVSGVQNTPHANALDHIAERYNVNLVYGTRQFAGGAEADVLLVDAADINPRRSRNFKYNLYRHFDLMSDRYDSVADYALYVDIAEVAYEAVSDLIGAAPGPHIVLAHEYMGMPVALKAIMEDDPRFRTIFYAHEVSAMRGIVESHPGHDVMFYNALARALSQGETVADLFGDQSDYYRHALVQLASHCDGIFAVGDPTLDELRLMGFGDRHIDLVYNGIPAGRISHATKSRSRSRLLQYAQNLLGYAPDVVMTHVTRPVISKGLWRDLLVLTHLDNLLQDKGQTGVFFVLTTAAGPRRIARCGKPWKPNTGGRSPTAKGIRTWSRARWISGRISRRLTERQQPCGRFWSINLDGTGRVAGSACPAGWPLRICARGTDVEFGQSIYEPFGIAVLEPLTFGRVVRAEQRVRVLRIFGSHREQKYCGITSSWRIIRQMSR